MEQDLHVAVSHGWKVQGSRNFPQLPRSTERGQVHVWGQGKSGHQAALLACLPPRHVTPWPPGQIRASTGHAMVLLSHNHLRAYAAPEPQAGQRQQALSMKVGAYSSLK